jgi:hypothetical protein
MDHIAARNWKRYNRSLRIESILTALNRSGQAEAKYFRGRSYLATLLLGRGDLEEMNESSKWNHVRITYQGKDAVEIFDSRLGPDGCIFTEDFTEDENTQIRNALGDVQIYSWQDYLSQNRLTKPLYVFLVLVGLALVLDSLLSGYSTGLLLGSGITLSILYLLLRR